MKKVNLPAKAASDLKARLMPLSQLKRMAADDAKLLTNFVDLLDKALDLDPAKRLTPKDALMVSPSPGCSGVPANWYYSILSCDELIAIGAW